MNTSTTMFDFIKAWQFLPSHEGKALGQPASNGERRRWFERGSVEVNGEKVAMSDPWPFSTDSVVLHPNGKNRTTLL